MVRWDGVWIRKVKDARLKRLEGWVGQGSRISPDLLNRLPATVEEERGRKWISTAEQQSKINTKFEEKKPDDCVFKIISVLDSHYIFTTKHF